MKAFELREMSDAELLKRIQEEEESLAHLRFQKVISQLENPMKIKKTRREIARMQTILRERELKGTAKSGAAASSQPVESKEQKA
ncbi:MAG: 50S ribosomal protein L29 [Ignavibacteriae bacterium]|nr:50S ribosomal protein L29 [Ignavibacteriota bacterium]